MDYEKKYKEALELARVAAFNGHQSLMEEIFPELAESEDERIRKRIIALVNAHGQGMCKDGMLAWLENIPYTIDHEKREGFHLGYKAALEKQGETSPILSNSSNIRKDEQKPDWSNKEKLILNDIIETTERSNIFKENYQRELIDWLKSLKQRYTWKPSDEQMKQLGWIVEQNKDNMIGKELISLYQDLKKLREE